MRRRQANQPKFLRQIDDIGHLGKVVQPRDVGRVLHIIQLVRLPLQLLAEFVVSQIAERLRLQVFFQMFPCPLESFVEAALAVASRQVELQGQFVGGHFLDSDVLLQ